MPAASGERRVPGEERRDGRRNAVPRGRPFGAGADELPAFLRCVPEQGGGQPVHQVRDGIGTVVGAVPFEEVGLFGIEFEAGGDREPVVGEVEPPSVGEDVLEVGVEVQQPTGVHERQAGVECVVHQGAGPPGRLVTGRHPAAQPVVQGLRDAFQEQREVRRGLPEGLDPVAYFRSASPVGHGAVHVGQFLGQRPSGAG
ncbi:hypothetical protein RKD26_000140 [Streptomyces calvus]